MGKYILTAFLKEKLAKDGWRVCVRNYEPSHHAVLIRAEKKKKFLVIVLIGRAPNLLERFMGGRDYFPQRLAVYAAEDRRDEKKASKWIGEFAKKRGMKIDEKLGDRTCYLD
ncbi:hypothetical protein COX86_04295 [Candidatus Micrarchaeota archaeon CG_4_10_14_0_2_um_filter_60_11]|nr:MAG: hypothetical protein AUJ16_04375 [Candidatus Micrarchaeota archaeon CG1_02_60_51]PIN95922.1 MAG: hypothetical protein COU39_03465 [Candidatus Micrarchaeota archaeon CG10_big_fil_rev_8_21_14_0_10_60_32]PIO02116.1 MAG: hypothetical protein COT58_01735 [Candidatus Micrarchaeota archaeon CG09_land_8_20_14_0_10_60_16]PIZ90565.1 MAG: hypothetical protein COX86_04295 [Candidatus Micrarchaeota archaeon CG_4_10_14_0_2_um_filter_60_11]